MTPATLEGWGHALTALGWGIMVLSIALVLLAMTIACCYAFFANTWRRYFPKHVTPKPPLSGRGHPGDCR